MILNAWRPPGKNSCAVAGCVDRPTSTPLTLPSLGLLDIIEATPGITVAEISRRLPTTQQSISQTIARMEKLGYVERRLGPRRGVGLHVTQAGRHAHHEGTAREL